MNSSPCQHKDANFFNGKLSTTNSKDLYIAWCPDCGAARTTLAKDWLLPRRHNPETQAVAYRNPETGYVCSREKWESMGSSFRQGMRQPLYAAPEVKENDD